MCPYPRPRGRPPPARRCARLLEVVEETGSLVQVAERLAIPYRTIVSTLRGSEANLGVRLVATQSGAAAGGGSRLTAAGRDCIQRWRAFSAGLEEWGAAHFRAAFEPPA